MTRLYTSLPLILNETRCGFIHSVCPPRVYIRYTFLPLRTSYGSLPKLCQVFSPDTQDTSIAHRWEVAIGRALQPFPRSKRSRHVSAHSAFQLGLSTLEGRIRRCRRRGAPAAQGRHLPSSLHPLASFLTGLP